MSFFKNFKNMLGVGPHLLVICFIIEAAAVFINQWIKMPIELTYPFQITVTVILLVLLVAGMAWFNFSLNLINVNFLSGKKELVIHGSFKYVRHPLYSTILLTLPELAIVWYMDLFFIIPWIVMFCAARFVVAMEERELVEQFGDTYKRYQKYVPALLPCKGPAGKRYFAEIMNNESGQ